MKVKFTELNSGYKGEHKVSRFSKKTKAKIAIVSSVVLAFLLVLVLSLVGVIPMDAFFIRVRVFFSGEDKNFPIETNTDSTIYIGDMDDSVVTLTSENLIVYTTKGKESYSVPHIYSKPGIAVNGDKAIVFDRGGKSFMLIDEKEVIYEGEADNTVFCGFYGDDGSYALGTLGDKTTGAVSVYNSKNENIFKWVCSKEYVSAVTISDNGKYIGASVVGAENGEIYTKLQFLGVEYKEPISSNVIKGATPLQLEFTKNEKLVLVTDKGVYSVDKDSKELANIKSYYSSEFSFCDFSSKGDYIVGIAKYSSKTSYEIYLFNSRGEQELAIPVNREVKSAYITEKYIVMLVDNQILVYNFNGKIVSAIDYKGEPLSLLPTDDFIYIESLDRIYRCFTYGNSSVTLNS